MKDRFSVVLILILINALTLRAQRIATFEVKISKAQQGLEMPVQINLDAVTFLPDSILQLVEVKGKQRIPVAHQIEFNGHRELYWVLQSDGNPVATKSFELIKHKPDPVTPQMGIRLDDGALTIRSNNNNLLGYNYKTVYPPAGVDTVFKRSGFIHPLWSPRGQVLTQINPPDHHHHLGLWNPWTEILFQKDTFDLWNLVKKQGTVKFAGFLSTESGSVFASYKALHEHVIFKKNGEHKVILNEVQSVKIYQLPANHNYYIADITIQLNCATSEPVLLLEYRYGGLGLRATKEWNKDNSEVITSEGKTRKDADGSNARWCMVQGKVNNDYAGFVFMSYPTNYNYPEPLRVWPESSNKRGDVFINFSPTKNMNWLLKPGEDYVLKYRFLVFNDNLTQETAEMAWQDFAHPPVVTIKTDK